MAMVLVGLSKEWPKVKTWKAWISELGLQGKSSHRHGLSSEGHVTQADCTVTCTANLLTCELEVWSAPCRYLRHTSHLRHCEGGGYIPSTRGRVSLSRSQWERGVHGGVRIAPLFWLKSITQSRAARFPPKTLLCLLALIFLSSAFALYCFVTIRINATHLAGSKDILFNSEFITSIHTIGVFSMLNFGNIADY